MQNYLLFPKVVPFGQSVHFELKPRFRPARMDRFDTVNIRILNKRDHLRGQEMVLSLTADGCLSFDFVPEVRGEYIIFIHKTDKHWPDDTALLTTSFFAIPGEWSQLRPYKGDLHIHSCYSDGDSSPALMAARARELGLDFAAITDHNYFDSSLLAIERARQQNWDILLYSGEEASYALGLGHILGINLKRSIHEKLLLEFNEWNYEKITAGLYRQLKPEIDSVNLLPGVRPEALAYSLAVLSEIHAAGGFAILAHPYWKCSDVFDQFPALYDQLVQLNRHDAVEVLGSVDAEDNWLSVARYQQALSAGPRPPIVGNSDTHRSHGHTFGDRYSLVFSESLETYSILDAIRAGRSLACQAAPQGLPVVIGPYEWMEYGYFLLREFFPMHDSLCQTLGKLYQLELETGAVVESQIQLLQSRIQELYDLFWIEQFRN